MYIINPLHEKDVTQGQFSPGYNWFEQNLALNNIQRFISYKSQPTNQPTDFLRETCLTARYVALYTHGGNEIIEKLRDLKKLLIDE